MADFETKLRRLSERGTPVGVEELIERIEAEMAGDPLIVVTQRRKGSTMTKTDEPVKSSVPGPRRGLGWAVAAFVVVLAVAGLYILFDDDQPDVATTVPAPTPTTAVPNEMTDLEVLQAGVTALYSGDGDTAAQLFDLPDMGDEAIRERAAYEAAIEGRIGLDCTAGATAGTFNCVVPYSNALTDALGVENDPGDTVNAVVRDGRIIQFEFPFHGDLMGSLVDSVNEEAKAEFIAGNCARPEAEVECANLIMENLDIWAAGLLATFESYVTSEAVDAEFTATCGTEVRTLECATMILNEEGLLD